MNKRPTSTNLIREEQALPVRNDTIKQIYKKYLTELNQPT